LQVQFFCDINWHSGHLFFRDFLYFYFSGNAAKKPIGKQGVDFPGTMPYKIAHWFENHEFVQTTMQVFHLFS